MDKYTQLRQAHLDDEMVISVCWEPGCCKQRLHHWDAGTWIDYPRQSGKKYSHGICRQHAARFLQDIKKHAA